MERGLQCCRTKIACSIGSVYGWDPVGRVYLLESKGELWKPVGYAL